MESITAPKVSGVHTKNKKQAQDGRNKITIWKFKQTSFVVTGGIIIECINLSKTLLYTVVYDDRLFHLKHKVI